MIFIFFLCCISCSLNFIPPNNYSRSTVTIIGVLSHNLLLFKFTFAIRRTFYASRIPTPGTIYVTTNLFEVNLENCRFRRLLLFRYIIDRKTNKRIIYFLKDTTCYLILYHIFKS